MDCFDADTMCHRVPSIGTPRLHGTLPATLGTCTDSPFGHGPQQVVLGIGQTGRLVDDGIDATLGHEHHGRRGDCGETLRDILLDERNDHLVTQPQFGLGS